MRRKDQHRHITEGEDKLDAIKQNSWEEIHKDWREDVHLSVCVVCFT